MGPTLDGNVMSVRMSWCWWPRTRTRAHVIHGFNTRGLAAPDPNRAGGRPRRIADDHQERSRSAH
ncbi:hypothetical protein ACFQ07_31395 [Actinomadura adrarensis]|uniref:Uncharacterized protein n=1 Tax=Actinomadura adrarensis TaxID=1819600 RepID=A0ABW3CRB6_9ACTN